MTVTNIELFKCYMVLSKLSDCKDLSVKKIMEQADLLEHIQPSIKTYEKVRNELLTKYGSNYMEGEKEVFGVQQNTKEYIKYMVDLDTLNEKEIEVDEEFMLSMSEAEIKKAKLNSFDIVSLRKFMEVV